MGMSWEDGDCGGWDEMFPTITPSACPDKPWEHLMFPDHGEVWSRPWRYTYEGDRLCMEVDGIELPYTLKKRLTLTGNRLHMEYELVNRAAASFSYLWAAHPLLKVEPGMKLHTIPAEGNIQLTYSHRERLGERHAISAYPLARTRDEGITDLSILEDASCGHAEKYYFTDPLQDGYAAITDPVSGAGIVFRFDPEEIPYLAIWAHYGAFGHYTVAPEPATGYLDSVQEAYNRGKVKQVSGGQTATWQLEVCLEGNLDRC